MKFEKKWWGLHVALFHITHISHLQFKNVLHKFNLYNWEVTTSTRLANYANNIVKIKLIDEYLNVTDKNDLMIAWKYGKHWRRLLVEKRISDACISILRSLSFYSAFPSYFRLLPFVCIRWPLLPLVPFVRCSHFTFQFFSFLFLTDLPMFFFLLSYSDFCCHFVCLPGVWYHESLIFLHLFLFLSLCLCLSGCLWEKSWSARIHDEDYTLCRINSQTFPSN